MENAPVHPCPYCGRSLARPADIEPPSTALANRLTPPVCVETRARDVHVGLALGLAVVAFMDIGVFVRRDVPALDFSTNILVALGLTILLALWYWRMRVDTAVTNAEERARYERQMERWNHTYYCAECDAVFLRD